MCFKPSSLVLILCTLRITGWAGEPAGILRETQSQGWTIVETENFRCQSTLAGTAARELAASCEAWRTALGQHWLDEQPKASWRPQCEVIVHPTQAAYNQTLGRPGDRSVGCTSLKCEGDRVVYRRIDVRSDAADWSNSALPHELTHVVLADRFGNRPLPRWIDEGLAMLAEADEKHQLRWTDLRAAWRSRPTYKAQDLMRVSALPAAALRDAFYGQSVTLVSYLIQKRGPAAFLQFVERLPNESPEAALAAVYGIARIADLDRDWRGWVERSADPDLKAVRPGGLATSGVRLVDRRGENAKSAQTLAD